MSPANHSSRFLFWLSFDCLAILGLCLLAGLLRFVNLTALPMGFHGDEAVAGIEGARILREGNIGPYSPLALGQPSGPLYLTAIGVYWWGYSILATRFFSALLGTLCVPLVYGFLRAYINRETALLGAGLLAITGWHIHFSRIGFPLVSWPLCATLAMWSLFTALQKYDWKWFAGAGALCGLGIYSYNAHIVFIATEISFLVAVFWRQRAVLIKTRAGYFSAFIVAILIVALPMLHFALNPANSYFSHSKLLSVFETSDWQQQNGLADQVHFLVSRYIHYWSGLIWTPEINYGDGTGTTPLVPWVFAALTFVGIVFAIWRRQRVVAFALWLMIISPLAAVITVEGTSRRTFLIVLSIVILAAFGLTETYKTLAQRGAWWRPIATVFLTLWVGVIAATELKNYYLLATRSTTMDWVFCRDLEQSIVWMKSLPSETTVFFLSDRWSFDYEPRIFLAPDIKGENRSREFGTFSLNSEPQIPHNIAWILIGEYRDQIEALQRIYPTGKIAKGHPTRDDGQPSFIGYYVP